MTTPATGHHWEEIHELVRGLGWLVVPWHQAIRTRYDLAIAACDWGLSELDAPAVLLSHGAGTQRSRIGPAGDGVPHAFHPDRLIRDGEVVPAALALASDREVAALASSCRAALPRAVVVGDPSFDRMRASLPYREQYRAALGARPGQKVVLAGTTWSPASLFGRDPEVFTRLTTELPPDEYRVVAALHPFVWQGHGRRQVLGWLADAIGTGLQVLDPRHDWRGGLCAADVVITDHGSVGQYAAALGIPVLVDSGSLIDVRPASTADVLSRSTPLLHLDRPLAPQVREALANHDPARCADVTEMITTRPGESIRILRKLFYDLLGLAEPVHRVADPAVALPRIVR
ncbi:hypothetical protein [Lentzea sp. NPDC059081]|uniref:hypothetical protein n=1 Tax=Lentzea sp. NPDC059081 TaxID=3346719 RepID=UPI0036B8030E